MMGIPYEVRDVAKIDSKPSKRNSMTLQNVKTMKMGKVGGQKPWVEFNGAETDESDNIIRVLSKVR